MRLFSTVITCHILPLLTIQPTEILSVRIDNEDPACPLTSRTSFCKLLINRFHWVLLCDLVEDSSFPDMYGGIFIRTKDVTVLQSKPKKSFYYFVNQIFIRFSDACMFNPPKPNGVRDFSPLLIRCYWSLSCSEMANNVITEESVEKLEISNLDDFSGIEIFLSKFTRVRYLQINDILKLNLTSTTLENQHLVTDLTLRNNSLRKIHPGTFSKLEKLERIDLSRNYLTYLPKKEFDFLVHLRQLDLSFNLIKELTSTENIPVYFYEKCSTTKNPCFSDRKFSFQVAVLDLSGNELINLPEKLEFQLKNFSCSKCNISSLNANFLQNSWNITYIDFSYNQLIYLPPEIFLNKYDLEYLDLAYNLISNLHENILENKLQLLYLNLTANRIEYLHKELFKGAPNIRVLLISKNILKVLTDDNAKYFVKLDFFDMSDNMITSVQLGAENDVNIKKLILRENFISQLNVTWKRFVTLKYLELGHNELTELDLPPCIPKRNKRKITFSFKYNKISKITIMALSKDLENDNENGRSNECPVKSVFDISANPINCDCDLYPFYYYITNQNTTKIRFVNLKNLTCANPYSLANESIISLTNDAFNCSFKNNCPQPCECGLRGSDYKTFVNCVGKNLTAIPHDVPVGTAILYVSDNKLSNTQSLQNGELKNLEELHADYSGIRSLKEWTIPDSLQYLSLKGNPIQRFPTSLLRQIRNNNTEIKLSYNYGNCDCSLYEFKYFLRENRKFMKGLDNIVCNVTNNGTVIREPLYIVDDTDLCDDKFVFGNSAYFPVEIATAMCTVLVISFFTMLCFIFRHKIIYLVYVRYGHLFPFLFKNQDFDDDKLFDAFIAHSSADYELVQELVAELEEKEPYFRLCFHERNFLPGNYITENILLAVEKSKRTILLLSDAFICSQWFPLELRAAMSNMSLQKLNRVIIILMDKSVKLDKIESHLRQVVTERTYLVWGETWFWEKLRYAMPHKNSRNMWETNIKEETDFELVTEVYHLSGKKCET